MNRDQAKDQQQQASQSNENRRRQDNPLFNETEPTDEKTTVSKEQEAALEQERKETLTERD